MIAPRVSVVIPTYNRPSSVLEAVDSCLEQQCDGVEIVVVDDGSTDNTGDALAPYKDRIRYIQQDHAGAPEARNTGAWYARGTYVKFLDSDDVLAPNILASQLAALERNKYDESVAITGDHIVIRHDGKRKRTRPPFKVRLRSAYEVADVIRRNPATSAPLYPRSKVLEIGGFGVEAPILQDYEFAFKFAINGGRYIYQNDVAYQMRAHKSGVRVSSTVTADKMKYQVTLLREQIQALKDCRPSLRQSRALQVAVSVRAAGLIRRLLRWEAREYAREVVELVDDQKIHVGWRYRVARARV